MRDHRRVIMSDGVVHRDAVISALTLNCGFCGEPLGSLAEGVFPRGLHCPCGAYVLQEEGAGESWPSSRAQMGQAFRDLKRLLSDRVVGHEDALARLSLMGARHLHRNQGQRALIIGPSGTGKTTLATGFAQVLGCPVALWDISVSAEMGWYGVDVGDVLGDLFRTSGKDERKLNRLVLICDEADKIAVRGATGTSREHRLGQQKSMLSILGGGVPIRFHAEGDHGRLVSIRTDAMMILGLGAFEGMELDPGPRELIDYGFMPELAGRFSVCISLGALEERVLKEVLIRGTEEALRGAAAFGYEIQLTPEAVAYAASIVLGGGEGVTPRAGVGWLTAAIDRTLVRLLELEARPDTGIVHPIRPDDIPIPFSLASPSRSP